MEGEFTVSNDGDDVRRQMDKLFHEESFCKIYNELMKNEEAIPLPKVQLHGKSVGKNPQSLMIYDLKQSIRSQYKNDKVRY